MPFSVDLPLAFVFLSTHVSFSLQNVVEEEKNTFASSIDDFSKFCRFKIAQMFISETLNIFDFFFHLLVALELVFVEVVFSPRLKGFLNAFSHLPTN